ncbi:MAG TPA: endonuclease [Parvularcula sp.]|nr:endonuclease [Parvularcula sp.]
MRLGGEALIRSLAAGLVLLSASCATPEAPPPASVRAMTYNIRLDTAADGEDAWPHRRQAVSSLIAFYAPDVFGLQEVMPHQLDDLRTDLPDYDIIGVGRDDGARGGEHSPVGFRKSAYDVEESGVFWLSETPDKPSIGFDAAYPRIETWVRLRDRSSRRAMLVLNTHWDHIGLIARRESASIIVEFLSSAMRPCEGLVLLGDFNAPPSEISYQTIAASDLHLKDARRGTVTAPFGPSGTFNGFDLLRAEKEPIDHIFVHQQDTVIRYGVITQHAAGKLPSDHYPVVADISEPDCAAGK